MSVNTRPPAERTRVVADENADRGVVTDSVPAEDLTDAATVATVLDAVAASERGEGALVIVNGAPGASCTGVLRRAVAARGRPSLWVHAMPGADDGQQGCMGQWVSVEEISVGDDATTATPVSGPTMSEFLSSVDACLARDTVIVVDNFHLLTPASANALLVWSQVARVHGATLLMGYHASLDAAGVGALLTMATDVRWIDLRWKSAEEVRELLAEAAQWSDDVLDTAVAATAGNPEMIRCLTRASGPDVAVDADRWPAVHRAALEAFGLSVLGQQDQDVQAVARVVAWVHPVVSVADVAQNLGLDSHVAVRVERLLRELALVSPDPAVMTGVRRALHDHTSTSMRRRCAQAAQAMLADQDATSCTRFDMVAEAADDLTGAGQLARAAYDEALSSGQVERASDIAAVVLDRSSDEQETTWAQEAQLRVWLRHDWRRAGCRLAQGTPVSWTTTDAGEMSGLFGLEAPRAAQHLFTSVSADRGAAGREGQLWSGAGLPGRENRGCAERVTRLAVRAFAGKAATADLRQLDAACSTEGGWLDTDAPTANRIGLTWLALADYERAQQWAALATFNAGPEDYPERGLGHLVRAHSLLRQGELERSTQEARAAGAAFDRVGATNLSVVAAFTVAHAQIEHGTDPGTVPELSGTDVHPLFAAYQCYVHARRALLVGEHQDAVRQLFETGRAMHKVCPNNPSLINWRLHLAALFRATGQGEFLEHIEHDIVRSWRRWAEVEPEAVSRRKSVLGRLAEEVVPGDREAVGLDALSPAERRVVDVVAQGKSNREVAKHLFLSKRTVDTHLGNVYRKLQIDSRDELGMLVAADTSGSTNALVAFG